MQNSNGQHPRKGGSSMKITPNRPSPAMVVALLALFVALGGSAFGLSSNATRSRAGHTPKFRLRAGKIVDRDTTPHDGIFNEAFGHARCKHGERLISGGLRLRSFSGGVLPGQNASMVESGPVPELREWTVRLNSDLGGLARKDFVVFAYCRS
jgi:hypothetical protein